MRIIKRQRTKGWRLAQVAADLGVSVDDIVYIGRPGPLANPYDWQIYGRRRATELFEQALDDPYSIDAQFHKAHFLHIRARKSQLRGKVFMGWCADWNGEDPPPDCHGVPLWRFVNEVTA